MTPHTLSRPLLDKWWEVFVSFVARPFVNFVVFVATPLRDLRGYPFPVFLRFVACAVRGST